MNNCRKIFLLLSSILLIVLGNGMKCEAGKNVTVNSSKDLAAKCKDTSVTQITLGKNITIDPNYVIKGSKKIVGNGHKLIRSKRGSNYYVFKVPKGASLEMTGLTYDGGKVKGMYGMCLVENGGKLKFDKTVSFVNSNVEKGGGVITNYGTVTMNGGNLSNNYTAADGGAILNGKDGKLVINGGTISKNHCKLNGGGIFSSSYGSCTISGGTIDQNVCDGKLGYGIFAGNVTITGKPVIKSNNDVYIQKKNSLALKNYTGGTLAINFYTDKTGTEIFTGTIPSLSKLAWSKNYKNAAAHPLTSCTVANQKKICVGGYFTVTFKVSAGSVCKETTRKCRWASKFAAFPTVTRTGYKVTNWSTTSTKQSVVTTVKVNVPCYLTNNITLYPIYVPNNYQVSFNSNGGRAVTLVKTVTYDRTYGSLPSTARTGYTFRGWFENKNGTSQIKDNSIVKITKNAVLYALWKPNTYQLTFDSQGGSVIATKQNVTYDAQYGKLPVPIRNGYAFEGWYDKNGTLQYKEGDKVRIINNTVLYAKWRPLAYEITFDAQGGEAIYDRIAVTYDSNLGKLPVAVRTGYAFEGWYNRTGTLQYKEGDKVKVTASTVLYAKWKPLTYQITFDTQGGQTINEKKVVTYDSKFGTLPVPKRTGYSFRGWYSKINGGIIYSENDIVKMVADCILYAKWEREQYTIRFNSNGAKNVYRNKNIKFGDTLGKLPVPARKNYIFTGWYTERSGGSKYTEKTVIRDGKVTILYAHWIKNDVMRITVKNFRTTYYEGHSISRKGVVVTAYYRDGTSKVITEGYTVKKYSNLAGKRKVTFTYKNKNYSVNCIWYGKKQFNKIKLVKAKDTAYVGQTKTIKTNAKYDLTGMVTYKSANTKIATVNKNGKVVVKRSGKVKITATISINKHKRDLVYVLNVKKPVIKISSSYCPGIKNLKFSAKVTGCSKKVEWSSSNKEIGTINKDTGLFTAKKDGITYITAKCGTASSRVKVVVKKNSIQCM